MKNFESKMQETKTVNAWGLDIVMPSWVNTIAIDEDGVINGYSARKPGMSLRSSLWVSDGGFCQTLGKVELEPTDNWRELVVEV